MSPGTVIQGNYIGTDVTGTIAIGNGAFVPSSEGGITISSSSGGVIGTDGDGVSDATEGNLISGNFRHGIRLQEVAQTPDRMSSLGT